MASVPIATSPAARAICTTWTNSALKLSDVLLPKPSHRAVAWRAPGGQIPQGHQILERLGNLARREEADRVSVDQQLQHQPRLVRQLAPSVLPLLVPVVERLEVQLIHGVRDEVCQVPFRHP